MKQPALLWTIFLLALTSLACNAFAGSAEPTTAPPTLPASQSPAPSDTVASGTAEATAMADSAEGQPTAEIDPATSAEVTVLVDLNVRSGPGVDYERVGFLLEGESALILGRNPEGSWWQIACPESVTDATDCWVSAGEGYSRADNADEVAEVAVPPTPTPALPALPQETGVLAYIDGGQVYVVTLDVGSTPPVVGEPQLVSEAATAQTVVLAPGGRRVAYIAGTYPNNSLYVVNIDGQNRQLLADSAELPVEIEGQDAEAFTRQIDQIAWLPSGGGVAFNTTIVGHFGPGAGSEEDLWVVSPANEAVEILAPGQGGGLFAFLPNGDVVLSGREQIRRAVLETGQSDTLISYPTVNTASEYIYYPQPVRVGASGINLAVPSQEPWRPEAAAALWQVPPTGAALRLGSVTGNILFNPVVWNVDGTQLAYVRRLNDSSNPPPDLVLAPGNGGTGEIYATASQLQFFDWETTTGQFLYATDEYYAVGQRGAEPQQIPLIPGQRVADAQWISAETFLVVLGFQDGGWEIRSATPSGVTSPLVTASSDASGLVYDLWLP